MPPLHTTTICPKCGSKDITPRLTRQHSVYGFIHIPNYGRALPQYASGEDIIKQTCICGYSWMERTADAKEDE
jgi:hypothetical protein